MEKCPNFEACPVRPLQGRRAEIKRLIFGPDSIAAHALALIAEQDTFLSLLGVRELPADLPPPTPQVAAVLRRLFEDSLRTLDDAMTMIERLDGMAEGMLPDDLQPPNDNCSSGPIFTAGNGETWVFCGSLNLDERVAGICYKQG